MVSERIHRDYRLEKDRDYFNIEEVLKPAGTPQPERTCASCAYYIPGKLELNCAVGAGSMGCTGPLRVACNKYTPKTNDTMEETKNPQTKVCKKCGRELPLEAFNKHSRSKDGLQPYCKECQAAMSKAAWDKRHAEGTASWKSKKAPAEPVAGPERDIRIYNDQDLAQELRRRGYDVKCTKTVEL